MGTSSLLETSVGTTVESQYCNSNRMRTLPPKAPTYVPPPKRAEPQQPAAQYQAVKDTTGTTFTGSGQPMQITLDQYSANCRCFKCGQPGHLYRDCPQGRAATRQLLAAFDDETRLEMFEVLRAMTESGSGGEETLAEVVTQEAPGIAEEDAGFPEGPTPSL